MDVARDHRPGHIGSSPQNTDAVPASRVTGMLQDFAEHFEPSARVDAYLGLPNVALAVEPGYYRDESQVAKINEAVDESGFGHRTPTAKNVAGPNLFGDL